MTTTASNLFEELESLVRNASVSESLVTELREADCALRNALIVEAHNLIREFDQDVSLALRQIAAELADHSLRSGDIELTALLITWARYGIPRFIRDGLIHSILSR